MAAIFSMSLTNLLELVRASKSRAATPRYTRRLCISASPTASHISRKMCTSYDPFMSASVREGGTRSRQRCLLAVCIREGLFQGNNHVQIAVKAHRQARRSDALERA